MTLTFVLGFLASASFATDRMVSFPINQTPVIGKTKDGQELRLGGFSGLSFQKKDSRTGELYFVTNTDRGPNLDPIEDAAGSESRGFPLPEYVPELVQLVVDPAAKTIRLGSRIALKKSDGSVFHGIPPEFGDATPKDLAGKPLAFDADGIDPEALLQSKDGTYWIAEEYGPSILKFDETGMLSRWFSPRKGNLPKHYQKRAPNRGFEALALVGTKLYVFPQSPLKDEKKKSRKVRFLEFDAVRQQATGEFVYALENQKNRISDAAAEPSGSILVLEQNHDKNFRKIFRIRPAATKKGKVVNKEQVIDLTSLGLTRFEKIEGMTLVDDSTVALINDNDFDLTGKQDSKSGKVEFVASPEAGNLVLLKLR